jgi:hypothetical protein
MSDMVQAKDVKPKLVLETDHSGVQTVASVEEVSVLAGGNAIEITYESGLQQYHSPDEYLIKAREVGEEFTYRAFNGHMMTSVCEGYDSRGRMKYSQAYAWHADGCHCDGDEPLPDW